MASAPTPAHPARRPSRKPRRPKAEGGPPALILHGRHPVEAALDNPARPVRRLWSSAPLDAPMAARARARGLEPTLVDRDALAAMLPPGAVHQGLALSVGPLPDMALEDLPAAGPAEASVVMVLDQVSDPHNVGAILRSAAALGARAVITQDRHAPAETATLAKAASGALERLPLIRVTNIARALAALRDKGYWSVGLDADAPVTLAGAGLTGPLALVLGAEGAGLRRLTRETCDHLACLPMTDAVESLNVSNAAAVALYELRRTALDQATPPLSSGPPSSG
ncbi:23S rRNA (guanosine(2251)-2'-O)-methyltransferase RlmB [Roseospira visakhapatnamensis]|uniref:23S rRNA (Guanosine2251-2'-O)-methyltransferase n=1 Tax=Roseospira visakhapatnamensis TaxID=390880 RepID=A0A7W6W9N3_9PROT|nr:23S rRNA (guanosine(2251)-2'-O)-methyltransferase RlmB [Roseospira visakhapatnamensis]MBB4266059.1 23S rRNA (guanosine2251-2'-O)-methyltransferase [Roseospira visakhapatnamensis]